jgi:hypothetical protein
MYKILLIETGEYLYHNDINNIYLIYSLYETKKYMGHFTDIFESLDLIHEMFHSNCNIIWLNETTTVILGKENLNLFEIIEV